MYFLTVKYLKFAGVRLCPVMSKYVHKTGLKF